MESSKTGGCSVLYLSKLQLGLICSHDWMIIRDEFFFCGISNPAKSQVEVIKADNSASLLPHAWLLYFALNTSSKCLLYYFLAKASSAIKSFGCVIDHFFVHRWWKWALRRHEQFGYLSIWPQELLEVTFSGWWFQIFVIFTPTWGNDPIWLILFKWVETTG